ncbi:MAG: hypothetical protein ACC669_06155, partial [bacterium]
MKAWKRPSIILFALFAGALFLSCGGGSARLSQPPAVKSSIAGSAVKGPLDGATIQLFYFDNTGGEVEIIADNAPVITDSTGNYTFQVDGRTLMGIISPLILRSSGGTMYGAAAPSLEGIIADPVPLTFNQAALSCNLSAASSVAAGLLRDLAQSMGFAPSLVNAQDIIALVESELLVNLADDPSDSSTDLAMFNESIDWNLDLINTSANTPAVNDLIDYLVANLSSSSGILDRTMDSPVTPGVDTTAVFAGFGTDLLDSIVPLGPSGFTIMNLAADKGFIENNGTDTATVTTILFDLQGDPSVSLTNVYLGLVSGMGSMNSLGIDYGFGRVQAELTSSQTGDNVVRSEFTLPNSSVITLEITVTVVDLITDSDSDGFSDGNEQIGWDIVVDVLGYGSDGGLLVLRHVDSDPNMFDTDADGMDDYLEYIVRTDPRSPDTDGDGLTDAEEWFQWQSSPTSVDTDGDSRGPGHNLPPRAELFDGNELFLLSTSPTLEDTDGDNWTDYEELDHPSRSPLVADLPKLDLEILDNIDVRLDVQFAEEAGQTRQYGAELTRSTTRSTSQYNSRTIGHSLKIGSSYEFSLTGGATVSTEYTFSSEKTVALTTESSRTAQASYSTYNTDARTRTESSSSGSMTMGIGLKNTGNITYTITQLGITVRQWQPGAYDPLNLSAPGAFTTVATLVPALAGGITLAPGSTSPVLQVQASGLNAARVKDLLARPDSLYLEAAYYELENAEGLNFAYLEEVTGPRTAMMFVDFGDGTIEEYRVAASVDRNSDGTYAGITLGKIMNQILDIPFETRPRQFLESGALTNENVLFKVRSLQTDTVNQNNGFWSVILTSSGEDQTGRDFEDIVVKGGNQVLLVYVKDLDGDGLYAAEEQHYRTDDLFTIDTDGDGLTDAEEVRGGWDVILPSTSYFITSDPSEADQDEDGLDDLAEMNSGTDPTLPDTDRDGLADSFDPHPLYPARVLHVKEGGSTIDDGLSWLTAMGSLTNALIEAKNGNATALTPEDDVAEIWVAVGRYVPSDTGDRTVSFELSSNISVYGGFAGTETKLAQRTDSPLSFPTTLSGDLLYNDAESYAVAPSTFADNSLHVLRAGDAVGGNTVLDGFFIIGGNASDTTSTLTTDGYGWLGGGLLTTGTPTLRNLFFRTNRAVNGAGAYAAVAASAGREMTVTDLLFNRNVAFYSSIQAGGTGGGMYYSGPGSTLNVDNSVFTENESWGSAGLRVGANVTAFISECVFDRNNAQNWIIPYLQGSAGGAGFGDGTKVKIERSRFTRNKATYGGGIALGLNIQAQIDQSVFWENQAVLPGYENYGGGGAVYARGGTVWFVNSTIAYNRAIDNDGMVNAAGYHKPGGIYFSGLGSLKIENTIIYGNTYT